MGQYWPHREKEVTGEIEVREETIEEAEEAEEIKEMEIKTEESSFGSFGFHMVLNQELLKQEKHPLPFY